MSSDEAVIGAYGIIKENKLNNDFALLQLVLFIEVSTLKWTDLISEWRQHSLTK